MGDLIMPGDPRTWGSILETGFQQTLLRGLLKQLKTQIRCYFGTIVGPRDGLPERIWEGMRQFIAFLRGINVGGHRVKMDRLRALFEELGLTDVSTFIASGNVVFSTDTKDAGALVGEIERHLARELGYDVATFLRSPAQLNEIVAFDAVAGSAGGGTDHSVYVVLLRAPAPEEIRSSFAGLGTETDEFFVSGTEIYWQVRGKISDSPIFKTGLEQALHGLPTTTRNMNTLRRLATRLRD
jgi:uncharacterized protein (DUF1697 family)